MLRETKCLIEKVAIMFLEPQKGVLCMTMKFYGGPGVSESS